MANNFFAKKMPCILHCNAKKISNTISSQVSGQAQLPGVFIYIVDHFGNYPLLGGQTCTISRHPNVQGCRDCSDVQKIRDKTPPSAGYLLQIQKEMEHEVLLFADRKHQGFPAAYKRLKTWAEFPDFEQKVSYF